MEGQANESRLAWIDIAKGIAMISILMQHIPFKDVKGSALFVPYVGQYHVPIFFLVAGFFLSTKMPLRRFVREKALRLLVPYLITCVVIGVFVLWRKLVWGTIHPPTHWNTVREFLWSVLYGAGTRFPSLPEGVSHIGAIWFLEALFVALVEIRIVLGALSEKPIPALLITGSLAVVAVCTRRHYIPGNLQPGLLGGFFVYLGSLYRKHVGLEHRAGPEALLVLAFIFFYAATLKIRPMIAGARMDRGILTLVVGLCACVLLLNVSRLLDDTSTRIAPILGFFGKHSLVVLCVHITLLDCGFHKFLVGQIAGVCPNVPGNVACAIDLVVQLVIAAFVTPLLHGMSHPQKAFHDKSRTRMNECE